jgi:hypothetical protein
MLGVNLSTKVVLKFYIIKVFGLLGVYVFG